MLDKNSLTDNLVGEAASFGVFGGVRYLADGCSSTLTELMQ